MWPAVPAQEALPRGKVSESLKSGLASTLGHNGFVLVAMDSVEVSPEAAPWCPLHAKIERRQSDGLRARRAYRGRVSWCLISELAVNSPVLAIALSLAEKGSKQVPGAR